MSTGNVDRAIGAEACRWIASWSNMDPSLHCKECENGYLLHVEQEHDPDPAIIRVQELAARFFQHKIQAMVLGVPVTLDQFRLEVEGKDGRGKRFAIRAVATQQPGVLSYNGKVDLLWLD